VGQRVRTDRTEVADNKVSNCGLRPSVLNVFGAGVAVLAGGDCAVTGNVIDGPEQPPEPVPALAVIVAGVQAVNVSRNRIRARARSETAPASGIGILATTSAVTIEDNDVEARGAALVWFPAAAPPVGTVALQGPPPRPGTVVGNRFEAEGMAVFVTAYRVGFTGNSLSSSAPRVGGQVTGALALAFSSNTLSGWTFVVGAPTGGTVVGNVGGLAIAVVPPPAAGIREVGLNVPSIAGSLI
jgi:hypothetical protein